MSKHVLLGTLILILVPISASAQGICPSNGTSSNKIVCVIPQTFGPFGLDSGAGAPLLANGPQRLTSGAISSLASDQSLKLWAFRSRSCHCFALFRYHIHIRPCA